MISNQTGSGGDEDAKADDEGGEEDEAESSEMSAGQKIIAANRKARLQVPPVWGDHSPLRRILSFRVTTL